MSDNSQKLKNAAEVIGTIEIIICIFSGIVAWFLLKGWVGFLVFVAVTGLGSLLAWTFMYLLGCIGEITEYSALQFDLLKTMAQSIPHANHAAQAHAGDKTENIEQSEEQPIVTDEKLAAGPQDGDHPNRSRCTIYFESRKLKTITCTLCEKSQAATRDTCFNCGCRFIYNDEK